MGRDMSASYSSLLDGGMERDPYDFTVYMDSSPLTVNSNSPLELVHQMFTKLGARYIIVNNLDGYCEPKITACYVSVSDYSLPS